MFWDTQAMAKSLSVAEKNVGPNGRYLYGSDPKFMNVSLYTVPAGRFWFGDLDADCNTELRAIANILKESVYVIPEWEGSDRDGRKFEKRAILKFNPNGE